MPRLADAGTDFPVREPRSIFWRPADSCLPWSDEIARAKPAGPCATFPGDDTWTAQPFAEGVVLIGDAAGYNDPIAAQGLSIALRDARSVRDLILAGARQPSDLPPTERNARSGCNVFGS